MTDALEAVLRRDRWVVAAALLAMTGWPGLHPVARRGHVRMAMSPAEMAAMLAPSPTPWTTAAFSFTVAMWAVMMVGMMIPSAAPMILIYARVARQAAARGRPFAATLWFAAGYVLVWCGFASPRRWRNGDCRRRGWSRRHWRAPAGIWRNRADRCRSLSVDAAQDRVSVAMPSAARLHPAAGRLPARAARLARPRRAPWRLLRRLLLGADGLLFVGGVMNVAWIAAITMVSLLEKLTRSGPLVSRLAGAACLAAGAWLLVAAAG